MLIDTDYIKTLIGITNTDDDALLNQILRARNVGFEEFESASRTEYKSGDQSHIIFMDHHPITAITSIYDDNDLNYTADTLVASTDYSYVAEQGMIFIKAGYFAKGTNNVKVTYTAGYTSATIPEDLKLALAHLVIADYLELKGGVNAFEGESLTYKPANLRKQANETLNSYRMTR
jgi:hypothetical protein